MRSARATGARRRATSEFPLPPATEVDVLAARARLACGAPSWNDEVGLDRSAPEIDRSCEPDQRERSGDELSLGEAEQAGRIQPQELHHEARRAREHEVETEHAAVGGRR